MKKILIYFPKSLSGLVFTILNYVNFLVFNIYLFLTSDIVKTIFQGKTTLPKENEFFYLSEFTDGYVFGIIIYIIELIIFLILFLQEQKKLNTENITSSTIKSIFVYSGIMLFIIEFLILTIIESQYILNLIRS